MINRIDIDPLSYQDEMAGDNQETWLESIEDEINSIHENDTFEEVKRTPGYKLIPTSFVFKVKSNSDGSYSRYKARLVVKGYKKGSVTHTYSPVLDFTTVFITLVIAIKLGYHLHQPDVKTEFLHGKINWVVFITSPKGSGIAPWNQDMRFDWRRVSKGSKKPRCYGSRNGNRQCKTWVCAIQEWPVRF